MARAGELFYIVHAYFARTQFGVNWQIYINVEYVTWHIISECQGIEGIDDTSDRVLWQFMTWLYTCKAIPWYEIIHS